MMKNEISAKFDNVDDNENNICENNIDNESDDSNEIVISQI